MPLYNLMEDAATAEISRAQLWQCLRHGASACRTAARSTGRWRTGWSREEIATLKETLGEDRFEGGHFDDAVALFTQVATGNGFPDFLTLPAYKVLNTIHDGESAD